MNTGINQLESTFLERIEQTWNASGTAERRIGPELKFPLVTPDGQAAPRETVDRLWDFLSQRGWTPEIDNLTGVINGVSKPGECNPSRGGCETGFCKIEFSLAHSNSLVSLQQDVDELLSHLAAFSREEQVRFLGYGIHPFTPPGQHLLIKQTRTSVWDHVCPSNTVLPPEEGDDVNLFTVNAGSHVHCSVSPHEAVDVVNLLNSVAPVFLALTANSPVWKGTLTDDHCVSEQFWDWWKPSQGRSGIPDHRFENLSDYLNTVLSLKPMYILREDAPCFLPAYERFLDYWQQENADATSLAGAPLEVTPEEQDLGLHNSLYWYCARISKYFTVELRCCDQQPIDSLLSISAMVTGLLENRENVATLMERYSWDDIRKARLNACKHGLQGTIGPDRLSDIANQCLILANEGLMVRGKGEDICLHPLLERAAQQQNPADRIRNLVNQQGAEAIVDWCSIR